MEFVILLLKLNLLILDVKFGTGTTKNVFLVQLTLFSIKIMLVFLSVINVKNTMLKDYVHHAILDMILNLDHVSSLNQTMLDLLTSDVPIGTGTITDVLLAPTGISSMLMELVFLLVIFVKPMMDFLELVLNVSRDSLIIMEFVNHQTQLNLQMLDVDHGTGIIKNVLLVLKTGL